MKTVDWTKVEKNAKGMKMDALIYTMNDCIEARNVSKGWNPENENYYQDLATVYSREIQKRRDAMKRDNLNRSISWAISKIETTRRYARGRLETGLKYGDDMLSSKELCIKDAISLMKQSISEIEAYLNR